MPWLLQLAESLVNDDAEHESIDVEEFGTSYYIRLHPGGDNVMQTFRKFEKAARVHGSKHRFLKALRNDWRKIRRLHQQNIAQIYFV